MYRSTKWIKHGATIRTLIGACSSTSWTISRSLKAQNFMLVSRNLRSGCNGIQIAWRGSQMSRKPFMKTTSRPNGAQSSVSTPPVVEPPSFDLEAWLQVHAARVRRIVESSDPIQQPTMCKAIDDLFRQAVDALVTHDE